MNIAVPLLLSALVVEPNPAPPPKQSGGPAVESANAPRRIKLVVDHSALLDKQRKTTAEDTAFFIREGSTKALAGHHGVDVARRGDSGELPEIRVALSWVHYQESIYGVELSVARSGEEPALVEGFECQCYDDDLTQAIVERLPLALERLAPPVRPEPRVEEEPPTQEDAESQPSSHDVVASDAKAAPIGGLGIAGIVVGAAGLGMTGFGVSRLVIGQTDAVDPLDNELGRIRDLRPSGRIWVGAGLAAVVVGATGLVLDLTVLRKRRESALAVTPALGPSTAGLMWSGRF